MIFRHSLLNRFGFEWLFNLVICAGLICIGKSSLAETKSPGDEPMAVTLTNILQVQQAASHHKIINCPVRFTGTILWIGPKLDQLILQDDSGGMAVKMDLHNQPPMQAGEKVLIEGNCLVTREGIISGPLIDNDGIHSSAENSESVYLFAGLCPISVEWFNGPLDFELKLDCAGPEMPRQPVPGAALFRKQSDSISETNGFVQGLDYAA